ncbi:RipA family octameric membrane protein [Providencia vermicola]|uniref:RipA family octameric membrane protein n=1 Tax=Providencia vermicola TaxID=333965 RepID=UPI003D2B7484
MGKKKKKYYAKLKKQYEERFDIEQDSSKSILKAFEQISDTRKFEIELYWKRTAYFWALIAMIFVAYFSFLSIGNTVEHKQVYLMLISSMGIVFTYAWLLANKGSKFWQENWENHLDIIEDKVTGPLYKTILKRPTKKEAKKLKSEGVGFGDFITRPEAYSVSKINQFIGAFVFIIWCGQAIGVYYEVYAWWREGLSEVRFYVCSLIVLFTILFLIIIPISSATHMGRTNPVMITRKTRISKVIKGKKKS